jgi:hypothetical protein
VVSTYVLLKINSFFRETFYFVNNQKVFMPNFERICPTPNPTSSKVSTKPKNDQEDLFPEIKIPYPNTLNFYTIEGGSTVREASLLWD